MRLHLIVVSVSLSLCINVFGRVETSFTGGVPAGWTATANWSKSTYEGATYPYPKIQTSPSNVTATVKSNASVSDAQLPSCDNIVVQAVYSNRRPASLSKIDKLQFIISTNAWSGTIEIGEPFDYYDSSLDSAWRTNSVVWYVEGLSNCTEFYYGLKAIAVGYSSTYIYLNEISADFLAGVRCASLAFDTEPQIGDTRVPVTATITKSPEDKISNVSVWAEIYRSGRVYTNEMFEAENGTWTNDVLKSSTIATSGVLDSGDVLRVSVFTKYSSTMEAGAIGDWNDDEGLYVEKSSVSIERRIPKCGSAWINEFSLDKVELLGTTNRTYLAGWKLELLDADSVLVASNTFDEAFDFTTNKPSSMVGMEVHSLGWQIEEFNNPYTIKLVNSAGVVEHEETGIELTATNSYGMTGTAAWPDAGFAYDWEGTPTNGTFSAWGVLGKESFGELNEGQYFEVEKTGWHKVRTVVRVDENAVTNFTYANVNYEVDFSSGATNGTLVTDSEGWTPVVSFTGAHTNEETVTASYEVEAFGWYSETIETNLEFAVTNICENIFLNPTIAFDGFSGGALGSYWVNNGTKSFSYKEEAQNGFARANFRTSPKTGYAELDCSNYINARGRDNVAISFAVCNRADTSPEVSDWAYVQVATNDGFSAESLVATSLSLSNRVAGVATTTWNRGTTVVSLGSDVGGSTPLYVRLRGEPGGYSSAYLDVDDIRIVFQDVAMPTNLVRSVGGVDAATPVNGESMAFLLDVLPQTRDEISEVSADLYLILNGVTNVLPFAFADGSYTNTLAIAQGTAQLTIAESNLVAVVGSPLLTGDEVSYFAAVRYNSANGATTPDEWYETRYFPDNSTIDGEGRWIVEGDYGVNTNLAAHSFTVDGPHLSQFGAIETTENGVKFDLHGYDENGISSLTVNLNGQDYHPFEGLDTNAQVRVTGEFELSSGLAPNTKYTVTITAKDSNGNDLVPATFNFTTKPTATAATITGVSSNEVLLTVSGNAAGYVVPAGWAQTSVNTWTRSGLQPNVEVTATGIYGTNTNNGVEQRSTAINATPGHTLAAVATRPPEIVKGTATVAVRAATDHVASTDDHNPDGTEYALRVTTSAGGDEIVSNNNVAVWKTLADWKNDEPLVIERPVLDLAATNYFSFVTRNFDGVVTANETPVSTNCWFVMEAGFVGSAVQNDASSRSDAGFGKVTYSLTFSDPAQSAGAMAVVQYKIGSGEWSSAGDSFAVVFDEIEKTFNGLTWNAWAAVGGVDGEYTYSLRAKVVAGNRESAWAEVSGTLDFAPPTGLAIGGTPAAGAFTRNGGYNFSASAEDANTVVYGWTLSGKSGTGSTFAGSVAEDGGYTVVLVATDAKGNACAPVSRSWTVDTVAPMWENPALSGTPEAGVVTNGNAFAFTASADDATALTYHWTLNGSEAGDSSSAFSGTATEGTNTVSVYAEDAAGNRSTTTNRTWVVDTVPPTLPVVSGMPANGAVTSSASFAFEAAAVDATALTYHWTLTGKSGNPVQSGTGATFSGSVAEDDEYTVAVYAVDEAGNVSPTNTVSWTFDKTPPEHLRIDGTPEADVVTNETGFAFTASADGATTYHWTLNGSVAGDSSSAFSGTAVEGTNTVSVYAVDVAGNRSAAVSRTWVVDTVSPTLPAISGTPANGAATRSASFAYEAAAADATALTYHWTLTGKSGNPGQSGTGTRFSGSVVEDDEYTVAVYAVDEAGNVSPTNTVRWTFDTTQPENLRIDGTPEAGVVTNGNAFVFTASADDATALTYHWTLNGSVAGDSSSAFSGTAAEGTNTVSVYAEDAAGNRCAAISRTWVVDTLPPTLPAVSGTPANGAVTSSASFAYEAAAEDATALTYHWSLNGSVAGDLSAAFSGTATEGVNEVAVYAVDEAGNVSPTNTVRWTLDTTPPENLRIDGTPEAGAITNVTGFAFTASADGATTYHWTLNGSAAGGSSSAFSGTAPEGTNTVSVTAEDSVGNICAAVSRTWVVDLTRPTVTLTSEPDKPFNAAAGNLVVTVAFSEEVTGFTAKSLEITNGAIVGDVEEVGSSNMVYSVEIAPDGEGERYDITIQVLEDAVTDLAGNGNDPASLTCVYDNEPPTVVGIESDVPEWIGTDTNFTVTVTFSEAVTNLTETLVTVSNGTVVAGSLAEVPGSTQTVYTVSISPDKDKGDQFDVRVWVDAGVAKDEAENLNLASSMELTRRCDNVKPSVTLTSETPDPSATNFVVTVVFSEAVTNFTAAALTVTDGVVVGEATEVGDSNRVYTVTIAPTSNGDASVHVQVLAGAVRDLAGNGNEASNEVKKPTVKITTSIGNKKYFNVTSFTLTVTFSEAVTGFTKDSITSSNVTLTPGTVSGNAYPFTVEPDGEGPVDIQVLADAVTDNDGNGNTASEALHRIYDKTRPGKATIIEGTPVNGATTSDRMYRFVAYATDNLCESNEIIYVWYLNGSQVAGNSGNTFTGTVPSTGTYRVSVIARDAVPQTGTRSDEWSWTVVDGPASSDVEFGGGVTLPVNDGATNAVRFTAVDFRPGSTSTFSLSGFEAEGSEISDLQMWFIVCDALGGSERRVPVAGTAVFNANAEPPTLTVTLPAAGTKVNGDSSGATCGQLFIRGVDNKAE